MGGRGIAALSAQMHHTVRGLLAVSPVFLFSAAAFYHTSRAIGRRVKLQQGVAGDPMAVVTS